MRHKNLLIFSLLVLALLPYFIICFYAMPFADDFCFGWTASENTSFLQKFLNQYLRWNGRYTADVLVNLHPLRTGWLLLYQLSLFTSLIATVAVIFVFIKHFVRQNGTAVIAALFIALFFLCYQPNVTEGVYWYIGITNYLLGNICILLHIVFATKANTATGNKKVLLLSSAIALLILSIGFNEVAAFIIPLFYFTAIIVNIKQQTANQKLLVSFFIIAVVASCFVFLSPGNFNRQNEFAERFNIWHSLLYASLQTIRFISKWSLSIPFAALSLLVLSSPPNIDNKFIKNTDYRLILALLIFTVFVGSFLPYFATGTLGQHRTINYVFFYFIFLWLWFLIAISKKFWWFQKLSSVFGGNKKSWLAIICIAALFVSENGDNILLDASKGNFQTYRNQFLQRQAQLLDYARGPILPIKTVPQTFTIVDAKADSTWWVNKCMMHFYDQRDE